MAYDAECFRDTLISLLQAKLPGKITSINTEKDDDNDLPDIGNDRYFWYTDAQENGYKAFIVYEYENAPGDNISARMATEITMNFFVVFVYNQNGKSFEDRLLRFSRIMKEIFNEGFDGNASHSHLEVSQLYPTEVYNQKQDVWWKMAGVQVKGHIT